MVEVLEGLHESQTKFPEVGAVLLANDDRVRPFTFACC
jgi:hypothetical protein